jgi:hypothetical protein
VAHGGYRQEGGPEYQKLCVEVCLQGTGTSQGWLDPTEAGGTEDPKGGLGVPNIYTELKALSAMVVGEWALTTIPQEQLVGDILQKRDRGSARHLVPQYTSPSKGLRKSLWATGRQWTELHFAELTCWKKTEESGVSTLREALRASNGMHTRWTREGLILTCEGAVRSLLQQRSRSQRQERGNSVLGAIHAIPLREIWLGDAQGRPMSWKRLKKLYPTTTNKTVEQIMTITQGGEGAVQFTPSTHTLPMASHEAHHFREVCLNLVANLTMLTGNGQDELTLTVKHRGEDPHHVFKTGGETGMEVIHTWGQQTTKVTWNPQVETVERAVAASRDGGGCSHGGTACEAHQDESVMGRTKKMGAIEENLQIAHQQTEG